MVKDCTLPGKKHRPVASHLQTLSHNVASSTPRHERDYNSQGRCFFPGPPVSSTNTTNHHDIAEILLKVALNTITLTLI
jgi:hypothetical protein